MQLVGAVKESAQAFPVLWTLVERSPMVGSAVSLSFAPRSVQRERNPGHHEDHDPDSQPMRTYRGMADHRDTHSLSSKARPQLSNDSAERYFTILLRPQLLDSPKHRYVTRG